MHDIIDIVCRSKRMPRAAFEQFGVTEGKRGGKQTARVAVYNEKGQVHSYFDVLPDGKGLFKKGLGSSGLFFPGRIPDRKETWLIVKGVEGAAALTGLGYLAAGLNTSKMARKYARLFRGCEVVLVGNLDSGSVNGMQDSAACLYGTAKNVRVARLPGEMKSVRGDDVRNVLARDGEQAVRQAIGDAVPWMPDGEDEDGDLPTVMLPGGKVSITQAASELGRLLGEERRMFVRGGAPVLLVPDIEGHAMLHEARPAMCCSAFEVVANLRKLDQNGVPAPAVCSESTAKVIINADQFLTELPPIKVLTRTPVLIERDGHLVQVVGYDQDSGVYAGGGDVEEVTLEEAKALFAVLLGDFKFASQSDRSRAVAAIVTPALVFGGLLGGRPPMDLGEADSSQAGKGYRNRITAAIYNDSPKCIARRTGGVGSIEEFFDRALIQGASFISLDNIRGKFDSQAIESFLTESSYWARVPYSKPMEIDPTRVVVMMTSNRAQFNGQDMANRSNTIKILKQDPGYTFRTFKDGGLINHVVANRARFLGAVFAVIREWHARGKPTTDEERHDFKPWVKNLDWIVQNLLDEAPLMDGHEESKRRMTNPSLSWLRDVTLAVDRAGQLGNWLKAWDLVEIIDVDGEVEVPGIRDEHDDLTDADTRKKVLQATGRRLANCFRKVNSSPENETPQTTQVNIDAYVIEREEEDDEEGRARRKYRFSANSPLYETAVSANPPITSFFSESAPIGANLRVTEPIGGIGGANSIGGKSQTTQTKPEADGERGFV